MLRTPVRSRACVTVTESTYITLNAYFRTVLIFWWSKLFQIKEFTSKCSVCGLNVSKVKNWHLDFCPFWYRNLLSAKMRYLIIHQIIQQRSKVWITSVCAKAAPPPCVKLKFTKLSTSLSSPRITWSPIYIFLLSVSCADTVLQFSN